jgi:hypothetical protein
MGALQPPEEEPPLEEGAPEAEAASALATDGFDTLREKASVEAPEPEPEERHIPIISELAPFQRFVLALMLFLNISVLGCLFLMVAGKITLVR